MDRETRAVTEQLATVQNKLILNQPPANASRLLEFTREKIRDSEFNLILLLNGHCEAFQCQFNVFRASLLQHLFL